jgi:hypothetical protein
MVCQQQKAGGAVISPLEFDELIDECLLGANDTTVTA